MILNVDFRCWLPARARFMAAWADQAHAVCVPVLEEEFAELFAALTLSCQLLPPSCRELDGGRIGFLFMLAA